MSFTSPRAPLAYATTRCLRGPTQRTRSCLRRTRTSLDSASMTLIDSEGRKSEANPDKSGYIPDDRNIFLENANPGITDRGQAIFTVAPD
jgi:hypothetical protein